MNKRQTRRNLYPRFEARRSGRLRVSDIHELYWEESGSPEGVPVVALHGGPGGGSNPEMRRFFDPLKYRIFLFDQRGCGRSTPHSDLRENTTWDLVDDIERLREHVGVDKWLVFGGSWGSTLSLAYGVTYPERTLGLVLRGIFTVTKKEVQWFYQEGASNLFPDSYDRYIKPIPEAERGDLVSAFYKRLIGDNHTDRLAAAHAWAKWEGETLSIKGPLVTPPKFDEDDFVDAFARIECHYFINRGFFPHDGWLLEEAAKKLTDIPGVIVHGRYDVVTPLSTAWALKKSWPKAELHIVPEAGHSSMEPGIVDRLIRATDQFADVLMPQINV